LERLRTHRGSLIAFVVRSVAKGRVSLEILTENGRTAETGEFICVIRYRLLSDSFTLGDFLLRVARIAMRPFN
jgi:hypothetical protein